MLERYGSFLLYLKFKESTQCTLADIFCVWPSCKYGKNKKPMDETRSIFWCKNGRQLNHWSKPTALSKNKNKHLKKTAIHYTLCRRHFNSKCEISNKHIKGTKIKS